MKISAAVICKNEEQFIPKWLNIMKSADEIVVVDTGSTDNSVQLLRDAGCKVIEEIIEPFDFSKARNLSVLNVSDDTDWIVTVDFDEMLDENWREKFEEHISHNPFTTAVWCKVNSLNANDEWEEYKEGNKKFYRNKYYQWKSRIHEHLVASGEEIESRSDIWLHHYANNVGKKDAWYTKLCIEEFEENGNHHALWFAIQHFVRNEKPYEIVKYCKAYLNSTKHETVSFRIYVYHHLINELVKQKQFQDVFYHCMGLLVEHASVETQNYIIQTVLSCNHLSFALFVIDTFGRQDLSELREQIITNLK